MISLSVEEVQIKLDTIMLKSCINGWDGPGSIALTDQTCHNVEHFISLIGSEFYQLPLPTDVFPKSSGTICMDWYISPEMFASLSFSDEKINWSTNGFHRGTAEFDNRSLDIPQIIQQLLVSIQYHLSLPA
jgi:hypothetical protein